MLRALPPLAALLLAAGCATGGTFPSLAPRPAEQLSFEEPIKVDPPVAPDPALRAQANELLGQARAGDAAFERAYAGALPEVRAAGAVSSETWVQAQEAISRVEAARIATTTALGALDRLIGDQSDDPVNDAVWADILAAREAVEALVADQRRRLDALKRSVSAP